MGIELLTERIARLLNFFGQAFDLFDIVAFHRLSERRNFLFYLCSISRRHFIPKLAQGFFGAIRKRIALVLGVGKVTSFLVFSFMTLCFVHHAFDVFAVQVRRSRNRDLLLLASRLVLRLHVDDAVRIDIKRNLDLRDAARRRRYAIQPEAAEGHVVRGHRPLTLKHMDIHG